MILSIRFLVFSVCLLGFCFDTYFLLSFGLSSYHIFCVQDKSTMNFFNKSAEEISKKSTDIKNFATVVCPSILSFYCLYITMRTRYNNQLTEEKWRSDNVDISTKHFQRMVFYKVKTAQMENRLKVLVEDDA